MAESADRPDAGFEAHALTERVQGLLERAELEKTNYQADYRIILPDGTIKHLHSVGHPVVNGSGDLVEFLGTTIDVTEQWQAGARLERPRRSQAPEGSPSR
jgi:PAS domain-containing protein